jgi:Mlc titration factor MtfA (ptsG expression regulator)
MGLVAWFREKRRKKILSESDLSDKTWNTVLKQHPILTGLTLDERRRLRDFVVLFIGEKQILFKEGMEPDDGVRLSVAVQACLPVMNLGFGWLDGWRTIYIVPEEIGHTEYESVSPGAWLETEDEASGEVMSLGSIALVLHDIEASGWGDGYNVVIHEIAHKLDQLDGSFDGRPPLHKEMDHEEWNRIIHDALSDLRKRISNKKKTPLPVDEYAAENIEEFFAVSTEAFFEKPGPLRRAYPELYKQLSLFYKQDPYNRLRKKRR